MPGSGPLAHFSPGRNEASAIRSTAPGPGDLAVGDQVLLVPAHVDPAAGIIA